MRPLAGLLVTFGLWLLPAGTAHALSCVDPETLIVGTDRAFIGTVLAQDGALVTVDVTETVRGELPDPLVLRDSLGESVWATRLAPGTEVGLSVYPGAGELMFDACSFLEPALLRRMRDEGWPRGYLRPWEPVLMTGGATTKMRFTCGGTCAGTIRLLAPDGAVLARRRVRVRSGSPTLTIPLKATARRRVSRRGRLAVRLVTRLQPVRRPSVRRMTLVWRP